MDSTSIRIRALLGTALVCVWAALSLSAAPEGQRVWFKFKKAFINSQYANGEALGQIQARTWGAAKNVHRIKCGGHDGELHIGALDGGLVLLNAQTPISSKVDQDDDEWGIVFELPDASSGEGPSRLKTLAEKAVTFEGYFRVWNEGHWKGAVHPSNPHHVFEVHPAWAFTSDDGSFENRSLIRAMTQFRGFGLSKYERVLDEVGDWLKAYQDDEFLFVRLQDSSNFFQLPIEVKEEVDITGGTALSLDVYSSNKFKRLVYDGLRGITVDGADVGATLDPGRRTTLLGILSVNLKTALDALPAGADSPENAVSVEEALEFFVFGKAKKPAWPKGTKCQ